MRDRATMWLPKAATMRAIPLAAVHAFLTRRGYVQQPSSRPRSRYYEHTTERLDDGRPLFYYFPAAEHFDDYPLRVLDFAEAQAVTWDLDPWDVLAELQGGPEARPVPAPVPA